jgi:hypothetical protein
LFIIGGKSNNTDIYETFRAMGDALRVGDGLNRFAELSLGAPRLGLGALALLFQPMAVDEAVALHRQCRRHPQGATRAFQTGIGR